MADKDAGGVDPVGIEPNSIEIVQPHIPPVTTPTIFVDGVANIAPTAQVVKFYLYRTDPDATGKPQYKNQVYAQVVMPTAGFIATAVFFERALRFLVEKKYVTEAALEELRRLDVAPPQS
jgi:hypothetical protein